MDGDMQNDPADIPMMLARLEEGYDLVHGWRRNRQGAFLDRKLPSKIANWLIARSTRVDVHDLGCALKVIRARDRARTQPARRDAPLHHHPGAPPAGRGC